MTGPVRVTGPLLDVLEVFLQALTDGQELHGWAILKATKRAGPTVYGVLDRLEDAGWVTGRWEDQPPNVNTPRRRLYRLSPTGAVAARDLLAARRPATVDRLAQQPHPGPAFIAWFRGLTGGAP
jgi:PadR family transcriptional regulator, regulatory protein PadR